MNKVDVGAYRIRPECVHLSLCMYSGVCDTPLRLIAAIPCPRRGEAFAACDSVPTLWGSFRSLQFRAHAVGKLSRLGIPCPRRGEAFAACNSMPTPWGSFRSLRFRARAVGKLSQLAILCPHCGEAFAACDSMPTLWGSFRGLRFHAHAVGKLSQSVNLPTARDYKSGVTDTSVINCSLFTINYQKFFILH